MRVRIAQFTEMHNSARSERRCNVSANGTRRRLRELESKGMKW